MSVRVDGLDGLERKFRSIEGEQSVSTAELFPPHFMRVHTNVDSFERFLERSPWTVDSSADFKSIPEKEWDRYVSENTVFKDWEAMLSAAARDWISRELQD